MRGASRGRSPARAYRWSCGITVGLERHGRRPWFGAARRRAVRGAGRGGTTRLAARPRRTDAGRSRHLRGVRAVPPPLPDLPADRRGIRVAPWAHRRDAGGEPGRGRARWHVRLVHGRVPGVPGMRGRVPIARAVRPDDGGRPRADRTHTRSRLTVPAVDRLRVDPAPPVDAPSGRRDGADLAGVPAEACTPAPSGLTGLPESCKLSSLMRLTRRTIAKPMHQIFGAGQCLIDNRGGSLDEDSFFDFAAVGHGISFHKVINDITRRGNVVAFVSE